MNFAGPKHFPDFDAKIKRLLDMGVEEVCHVSKEILGKPVTLLIPSRFYSSLTVQSKQRGCEPSALKGNFSEILDHVESTISYSVDM